MMWFCGMSVSLGYQRKMIWLWFGGSIEAWLNSSPMMSVENFLLPARFVQAEFDGGTISDAAFLTWSLCLMPFSVPVAKLQSFVNRYSDQQKLAPGKFTSKFWFQVSPGNNHFSSSAVRRDTTSPSSFSADPWSAWRDFIKSHHFTLESFCKTSGEKVSLDWMNSTQNLMK